MSADVTIVGDEYMLARLKMMAERFPKECQRALRQIGEEIMTDAKQNYVPVDLGALRASGFVRQKSEGDSFTVTLGFGGPSAPYALIQHENMEFNHTVGGPKYLERPAMARANSIPQDIVWMVNLPL